MKTEWFKKRGWFYLPSSVIGAVIFLFFAGNAAIFFKVTDHYAHSVSDSLISFFPFAAAFWVFYEWIAKNTSKSV
jgi:hypothetical protein